MPAPGPSRIERRTATTPLVGASRLRPERIARLRGVFEQLAARCAGCLADLTPSPVQLTVRELSSGKAGEYLAGHDGGGAAGVFRNPELGAPVLIGADGAGIDAMVEAAFGADGSEPAHEKERSLSRMELRLAGAAFQRVARALDGSYAGSEAAALHLEKVEVLAAQPPLVRRDDDWLIASFELTTLDRTGTVFILLPQTAIQGLQENPADKAFPPAGRDPRWNTRMQRELTRTHVTLQAVLDERDLTLGDIAGLRVGQMLPLRATPQSQVKIVCNEQALFWCELGQAEGAYTLRVQDFADEEQDLIDAILSD